MAKTTPIKEVVKQDKSKIDKNDNLVSTPQYTDETLILIGKLNQKIEDLEKKHYIEFDWKNWKQYPIIAISIVTTIFFFHHYINKLNILECKQRKIAECWGEFMEKCNLKEYIKTINECEK